VPISTIEPDIGPKAGLDLLIEYIWSLTEGLSFNFHHSSGLSVSDSHF
jgi:hypothetical protein